MPEEQKNQILLTELLAQEHPDVEDVMATFREYVETGMFIYGDAVAQNLNKVDFSAEQLESLSVLLAVGIEHYKERPKLVSGYERVRSYVQELMRKMKKGSGDF